MTPGDRYRDDALIYPQATRGNQTDDFHGVTVADPYRWLESASASTESWIAAENLLTRRYLDRLPLRRFFADRLERLIDYQRIDIPQQAGDIFVYARNAGRQEQDVIWVTDDLKQPGRVLIDPNKWPGDGTVSIGSTLPSPDGRYLAYSTSDGGSDWKTWRFREIATGLDLPDRLTGIKFSGISFAGDLVFYSRYPAGESGFDDARQVSVWIHRLGTDQSADTPLYSVTDHAVRNPYAAVTDDGQYLIFDLFDGYQSNGIYYQAMVDGRPAGPVVRLLDSWDARYRFLGNSGDRFFFHTTASAPLGRVIAIDLSRPESSDWIEIVAETGSAIESASRVGDTLFIQYIIDAHAQVRVVDMDGKKGRWLELPGKGTVAGFNGRSTDRGAYFSYSDFHTPASIYRYELATGESELLHRPELSIDSQAYRSRQVFYASRDGTQVPMTLVYRADIDLDQPHPTVLYGYGGFGVSLLPRYSTARMAWLEAGGIYAVANLRGGGEYGEAWHLAGIKQNKQNVFDDFIAAAEWLISEGVTSPEQLAIWGGSNGGLLVGAVSQQRPDLFSAAVPAVGVMDMLRYHTASANARQWSSDYGLAEIKDEFAALYAYSPYHNLSSSSCYPATLVLADANDDRVAPWHSYKYAAALQFVQHSVQQCEQPVLIRIDTRTGHGAGASVSKIVDEFADQWAFVAEHTGLQLN